MKGLNDLLINGPSALIAYVRDECGDKESPLDFANVLAPPQSLGGEARERWCEEHWGSPAPPQVELIDDEGGLLYYVFATPSGPPLALIGHLAALFPALEVELVHTPHALHAGLRYRWRQGRRWEFRNIERDLADWEGPEGDLPRACERHGGARLAQCSRQRPAARGDRAHPRASRRRGHGKP